MTAASVYDFEVLDIDHRPVCLADYRGKVLLIVNVASRCGLTPQYKGLQKLYDAHREAGFEILGFPCNQFRSQEPGNETEIKAFCETSFGVTFPLFAKLDVNGEHAHPLYRFLKSKARGVLWSRPVKWNFTKFLVDRQGRVLRRFAPAAPPEALEPEIARVLSRA